MTINDPRIHQLQNDEKRRETDLKIIEGKIRAKEVEIRHLQEELRRHEAELGALQVEEKRDEAAITTTKAQITELERRLEAEEKLTKKS